MMVKHADFGNGVSGIDLIAENDLDKEILRRFDKFGIKINSTTGLDTYEMQLTFKDLVDNEWSRPIKVTKTAKP